MKKNQLPVLAPIAEKVFWTFAQAFLVALLAMGQLDWSATQAALAAGITAVITLGFASVQSATIPQGLSFYSDLGLRVARSAVAAFLAYLLIEPNAVLQGDTWEGALGAAGMAILVVIKGGAARFTGNPNSPATLPAVVDPVPDENGEFMPADDDEVLLPGEIPELFSDEG